jgi:hypothetical protein
MPTSTCSRLNFLPFITKVELDYEFEGTVGK